ncbi:Protein arginine methyltransferase NDUFAF7 [Meloidogyne graminicola]|uniref:Protein arginine methyltransferase NDUFAF7 n=1 Tax=Meloidogyne graminicola TaxID=189291 RepID=A0A8S9ZLJ6_9BILA|nr:Protein arginine methyltransferase NDUFAF7 [Meloidogyne graminicola]
MFISQLRSSAFKFKKKISQIILPSFNYYFSTATSSKKPIENENALEHFIIDKLRSTGPISVSEYMKLCVSSQYGYYAQKAKIFGDGEGDFITSPELTQVFAWLLNELHMTGWDGPWNLVELGPGSGALMVDVLNVLNKLKSDNKCSVHLIEKSSQLIKQQKQIFTIFISNEFFDALPIHQFVRNEENPNTWHEVYVQLSNGKIEIDEEDGQILSKKQLCFGLSPGENIHTRAFIPKHIRNDLSRTKWEYSPMAITILNEIVKKFTINGGFALIIDYGHDGERRTHSLRAYSNHSIVDPLDCPGRVDLTADVDFGELKRSIKGKCLTFGPVEQRQFLTQLGLIHRLDYLLRKSTTTEQREALLNSCNILVSDAEMGERFKVFSLFPNTLSEIIKKRGGIPAGFASPLPQLEDENLIND